MSFFLTLYFFIKASPTSCSLNFLPLVAIFVLFITLNSAMKSTRAFRLIADFEFYREL